MYSTNDSSNATSWLSTTPLRAVRTGDSDNGTTPPGTFSSLGADESTFTADVIKSVVLALVCLVATVANLSLWMIVVRTRSLRTESNFLLLACLSLADLLVATISMPVTIATIMAQRWIFSSGMCTALGYLNMLTFTNSVQSLGAISINRYVKICRPNTFYDLYTPKKVALMCAGVWLYSAGLSVPPLVGWGVYGYLPLASICFCDWATSPSYALFMVGVCFCLPCSAMLLSYCSILRTLVRSRRTIEAFSADKHGQEFGSSDVYSQSNASGDDYAWDSQGTGQLSGADTNPGAWRQMFLCSRLSQGFSRLRACGRRKESPPGVCRVKVEMVDFKNGPGTGMFKSSSILDVAPAGERQTRGSSSAKDVQDGGDAGMGGVPHLTRQCVSMNDAEAWNTSSSMFQTRESFGFAPTDDSKNRGKEQYKHGHPRNAKAHAISGMLKTFPCSYARLKSLAVVKRARLHSSWPSIWREMNTEKNKVLKCTVSVTESQTNGSRDKQNAVLLNVPSNVALSASDGFLNYIGRSTQFESEKKTFRPTMGEMDNRDELFQASHKISTIDSPGSCPGHTSYSQTTVLRQGAQSTALNDFPGNQSACNYESSSMNGEDFTESKKMPLMAGDGAGSHERRHVREGITPALNGAADPSCPSTNRTSGAGVLAVQESTGHTSRTAGDSGQSQVNGTFIGIIDDNNCGTDLSNMSNNLPHGAPPIGKGLTTDRVKSCSCPNIAVERGLSDHTNGDVSQVDNDANPNSGVSRLSNAFSSRDSSALNIDRDFSTSETHLSGSLSTSCSSNTSLLKFPYAPSDDVDSFHCSTCLRSSTGFTPSHPISEAEKRVQSLETDLRPQFPLSPDSPHNTSWPTTNANSKLHEQKCQGALHPFRDKLRAVGDLSTRSLPTSSPSYSTNFLTVPKPVYGFKHITLDPSSPSPGAQHSSHQLKNNGTQGNTGPRSLKTNHIQNASCSSRGSKKTKPETCHHRHHVGRTTTTSSPRLDRDHKPGHPPGNATQGPLSRLRHHGPDSSTFQEDSVSISSRADNVSGGSGQTGSPKKKAWRRQVFERRRREEYQLTASLLVVIIIFIVCWFPYCVSMFVSIYRPETSSRGLDLSALMLGYVNSCVNPIVYGLMNKRFKTAFKQLYSCKACSQGQISSQSN